MPIPESVRCASPKSPRQSRAGAYYHLACHSSCQAHEIARRYAFFSIPFRSVIELATLPFPAVAPRHTVHPCRPRFLGPCRRGMVAELSTPYPPRPCHSPTPRWNSKQRPSPFSGGPLGRADTPSLKLASGPHLRRCSEASANGDRAASFSQSRKDLPRPALGRFSADATALVNACLRFR